MEYIRTLLPPGYEIHTSYDATEFIQDELNKIYVRTGLTVLILLMFVLLITREIKYLLLIIISLSINLSIAVILYYLSGLEMQLYSLAGVTISLSLVIDNTIVMTEHIRNRHNRKAILSILAATLTTIGALVIIFFLDEKIRLNLQDFAAVVIINLGVSLLIALFLVPALIDKMNLEWKKSGKKNISGEETEYTWKSRIKKRTNRILKSLLQPVLSMSDRFPLRMEEIGMFHFTVSIRHPGFPVTGKNRIRHERQKEDLHGNRHPANRYI